MFPHLNFFSIFSFVCVLLLTGFLLLNYWHLWHDLQVPQESSMFEDAASSLQIAPFHGDRSAMAAKATWDVNATVKSIADSSALLLRVEDVLVVS